MYVCEIDANDDDDSDDDGDNDDDVDDDDDDDDGGGGGRGIGISVWWDVSPVIETERKRTSEKVKQQCEEKLIKLFLIRNRSV